MRVVEMVCPAAGMPGDSAADSLRARPLLDDLDLDGPFGAGVDACWFEAIGKAAVAHIALAHHTALWIELRHAIGAIPDAVLATDAGIGGMQHDACDWIFGVGIDRAALQAIGIEAMVAAHREVVAAGVGVDAAFNLADAPPANICGISVLLVAGNLAGAAADALRHIEVEAVLLSWLERTLGNERGTTVQGARRAQRRVLVKRTKAYR